MRTKNNRLINMLFFHESWDTVIIKNDGPHTFPTNTLDILTNTKGQQLKKNIPSRPILSLLKGTIKCMFFMKH